MAYVCQIRRKILTQSVFQVCVSVCWYGYVLSVDWRITNPNPDFSCSHSPNPKANNSNRDAIDNVYGAFVVTVAIARVHQVHEMNADLGR